MDANHQDRAEHLASARSARIREVAAGQLWLITTPELIALGLNRQAINHRVRSGLLFPIYRGVYAAGSRMMWPERRWLAAVLAVGPDAALAGKSAALLRGVARGSEGRIRVATTRQVRRHLPGVDIVRLADPEIAEVRGVPCLSVPHVVVDLGRCMHALELAHVIHQVRRRRLAGLGRLEQVVAELGNPTSRTAMALHRAGCSGERSLLERRVVAGLTRRRFRGFAFNEFLELPGGAWAEVDLLFAAERLCVEIDGPDHDLPAVQADDRARDEILASMGFRVLRLSWVAFELDPEGCLDRIEAALGMLPIP